ncbi:class I SAM-dependent methyltransferase [Geodermatophilus sp. SYSU D01105]
MSKAWPPLPFDDGRFDLVLGYSVFTHLPVDHQDAWLAELRRVTRPGGLLLLTVHGRSAYANASTRSSFHKGHQKTFEQEGFIYWSNDYWRDHFPAYYQTAYHDPSYIARHSTR